MTDINKLCEEMRAVLSCMDDPLTPFSESYRLFRERCSPENIEALLDRIAGLKVEAKEARNKALDEAADRLQMKAVTMMGIASSAYVDGVRRSASIVLDLTTLKDTAP